MTERRKTPIQGILEIFPKQFHDPRGMFFESFRQDWFQDEGIDVNWVQDNQSSSKKGTIRGLHFQRSPFAQAKLVRVIQGRVLDVVVDLRLESETFGQVYQVELSAKKNNQMYIPAGFAHGFSVLEECIFSYKCSNYYHKESEGGILWNDPKLDIDWGVAEPTISEKDQTWPTLEAFVEMEGGLR